MAQDINHPGMVGDRGMNLPSADPLLAGHTAANLAGAEMQAMANAQREYMMTMGDFTRQMKESVRELSSMATGVARGSFDGGTGVNMGPPEAAAPAARPAPNSGLFSQVPLPSDRTYGGPVDPSMVSHPDVTHPGGTRPGPADSGVDFSPTRPGSGGGGDPDAPPMFNGWAEGRAAGGSMTSIRQSAALAAAKQTSKRTRAWDNEPSMLSDGSMAFHERDTTGRITNSIPVQGNSAEAFENAAAQVDMAMEEGSRRNNRLQYATGVLQKVGAGEGITSALGGTVAKAAGAVGLAVGVTGKVFDTLGEQTEKGAEWRRIYGQDAGRFALDERRQSWQAGVGSFFDGEGFGRGQEAFNQASAMGLSGSRRKAAQQFASDMYMDQGMETSTAMEFVGMNSRNAQISLSELGDQIGRVSEAAVAAGKNSEQAISAFKRTAEGLQQNVSDTGGASAIAAGLTETITGRIPDNLRGENGEMAQSLTGLLNESSVFRYAAMTGQNGPELMNQLATDETGQVGLSIIGGSLGQAIDAICRAAGTTKEAARKVLTEMYGGRMPSSDEQADALARFSQVGINFSVSLITRVFSAFRIAVPAGQALQFFFAGLAQETNLEDLGQQTPSEVGSKNSSAENYLDTGATPRVMSESDVRSLDVSTGMINNMGGDMSGYKNYLLGGGKTSPVVEDILNVSPDTWKSDTGAETDLRDVKFLDGGKELTLPQIIADKDLLAKLEAGDMAIKGRNNQSLSLSKYADIPEGESGSSSGGTEVKIGLTDEGRRLLTVTGSSPSQRAGVPAPGDFSPADYGIGR